MLKKKRYLKLIAWVVLMAFGFQAAPVYALDTLSVPSGITEEVSLPEFDILSGESETEESENPAVEEETDPVIEEEESESGLLEFGESESLPQVFEGETTVKREIDGELEELREPDIKYFLNDDKTITAAVYPYDVHYKDADGEYQDIDNRLKESTDKEIGSVLENKENSVHVKFSQKANERDMVKMEIGSHEISWGLENADETGEVQNAKKPEETLAKDPLTLTDVSSTVSYPQIRPDVDLCYDVIGTDVKERIVLKNASAERSFRFIFKTNGLTAKEADGHINMEDADGETVYTMAPMFMYDTAGSYCEKVTTKLEAAKDSQNDYEYVLTVTADSAWLNETERAYPVTIDPTITIRRGNGTVEDCHVSSESPNVNYCYSNNRVIGKDTSNRTSYTYVKFVLPNDIKESDRVVSAYLSLAPNCLDTQSLFSNTITEFPYLCAYETETDWNSTSLKWNNKPAFKEEMIDYDKVENTLRFYSWDITKVVNGDGLQNSGSTVKYGVTLKTFREETASKRCYFESGRVTDTTLRPQLQITYMSMIGLEDYWTYHEQSAGLAGSGFVNDFTGELTACFEDISLTSEKQPLSIGHVYTGYNANAEQSTLNVGAGWRLNIQETIEQKTIAGETKYLYTDGDGTQHYFENDNGTWKDDSGLDLTLTITSTSYTIKDKKDNKKNFTIFGGKGHLQTVVDNHNNTTRLTYTNGILTQVKDSSHRTITFTRESGNRLKSMTLPDGRVIEYSYGTVSGNGLSGKSYLTEVKFPGLSGTSEVRNLPGSPNIAIFKYTDQGTLTDMIDTTRQLGVYYTYDWVNKTRRVNSYNISSYNGTTRGTLHSQYTIEYSDHNNKYTEALPDTGRSEIYNFNYMGQTVSAQDHEGNALFCATGMSGGAKNKVTFASKTQKTITNYLKNHSFEQGTTYYVADSVDASSTLVTSTTNAPALYGSKYLCINAQTGQRNGMAQTVSVKGGRVYTFSAYMYMTDSAKAYISISGDGRTESEENIFHAGSYSRYDVSLDLTNRGSGENINVTVRFGACPGGSGNVYFDALQLESGECSSRYNMIENGGFEAADSTWTLTNSGAGNPSGVHDGRASAPGFRHSGTYGYMITGSPKHNKQLTQTLNLPVKKGEGLVYGVWIKSNALPNKDTSNNGTKQSIGMTVELTRSGGSSQFGSMTITPTSDQWIYICNEMIANNNYTGVKIYLKVNKNANTTCFDDVQIYKDTFGESFVYDAKGNVISVTDMAKNTQNAAVNGNNDLTTYTDGKGNVYNFQYDGGNTSLKKHNLTKVTAPDNTYTKMQYNNFGVLQYVSVYDREGSKAIRTSKTYSSGQGTYLATSTDQLGKVTTYDYDGDSGLLYSVSEPYGNGAHVLTQYTYDLQTHNPKTVEKDNMIVYYDVSRNMPAGIHIYNTIDGNYQSYLFDYTPLGNLSSVSRSVYSGSFLEKYFYENDARGNQTGIEYANGQKMAMTYDDQDRLTSVKDVTTAGSPKTVSRLCYNANGLLGKSYYLVENQEEWTKYQYDFAERYIGTQSSMGFSIRDITYDKNDNNTGYEAALHRAEDGLWLRYTTRYGYNSVNNLQDMKLRDRSGTDISTAHYEYDTAGRPSYSRHYTVSGSNTGSWASYEYYDRDNTTTTNLVSEMRCRFTSPTGDPDYTYYYDYDDAGNVKSVYTYLISALGYEENYTYDVRNQLTSATNYHCKGKDYAYSYDQFSNITGLTVTNGNNTERSNTYNYNANIPDELSTVEMKVNGVTTMRTYTYDANGNPTQISEETGGVTTTRNLVWEQGKQLKSITLSGKTYTFSYDDAGRVVKKVCSDGSYIQYHYDGDGMEYEERFDTDGTLEAVLKYFYDDDGKILYTLYKDDEFNESNKNYSLYHYIYNGLGEITDIVKVREYVNGTETAVQKRVGHYDYDPYGLITEVSTYNNDNFAEINPIRYKQYYYDADLAWYNLETRYYDPTIGRFINADDLSLLTETDGDITDKNLYNYCDNNPIMRADNGGEFWHVVVGTAINVAVDMACTVAAGEKITLKGVATSVVEGAVMSAIPGGAALKGLKKAAKVASEVGPAIGFGLYSGVKEYRAGGDMKSIAVAAGVSGTLSFAGQKSSNFIKIGKSASSSKSTVKVDSSKRRFKNARRFVKWMNKHTSREKYYQAAWKARFGTGTRIGTHYYLSKKRARSTYRGRGRR